jgi:hypothetical protein
MENLKQQYENQKEEFQKEKKRGEVEQATLKNPLKT